MANANYITKLGFLILFFFFIHLNIYGNAVEKCERIIKESIQAAEKKDHVRSLELLTEGKIIAEENNLHRQLFWILTNIGINYAEMLDYSEALDNFLEAYKIALKNLDTRSEMSILNNIAGLYYLDRKNDKAEEYYKKVFDYALEIQDSTLIGGCALNMVLVANETKNIKEAEKYLEIAESMIDKNLKSANKLKSLKINNLILQEQYNKAEEMALELLPFLDNINDRDTKISVLTSLALINQEKSNIPQAAMYAKRILNNYPNLENRINIYNLLAKLYEENGDYILALSYKDSVMYTTDSLTQINNSKHFEISRIKFELLRNEKELSESRTKLKKERIIYILILVMALLLIWAFRNNFIKERQRKKIVELELQQQKNIKLLLEKQLKEQETMALLENEKLINEQEKLKYEIESKNRELASKALFLSKRNELIENIIRSLSTSQHISGNPELVKYIHQLKNQLKQNTEWDGFISHFENVNHNFINALREKHPDLKAHEIRFLSYMYINLNTKEISSLLNITPEYCKKKKQQIAHKLNLKNTSLLYQYLSSL